MNNSTERLQQIFNNKPVKQKPRNIIYSNEMVKDLTDIINAKTTYEKFLIADRLENGLDYLQASFESIAMNWKINSGINNTLSEFSTEMCNWYSASTEAVGEMIDKIKQWFANMMEKIGSFIHWFVNLVPNFIKKLFLARYSKLYEKYKKDPKKFNPKTKVTSRLVLSGNTFDLIKKSTVDYTSSVDALEKLMNEIETRLINTQVSETELDPYEFQTYKAYEKFLENGSTTNVDEDQMISKTVEGNLEEFGVKENTSKRLTSIEDILGKKVENNLKIISSEFTKELNIYIKNIRRLSIRHKKAQSKFADSLAKGTNYIKTYDYSAQNKKVPEEIKKDESHINYGIDSLKITAKVLSHNMKYGSKRIKAIMKICALVYSCLNAGMMKTPRIQINGKLVEYMESTKKYLEAKQEYLRVKANCIREYIDEYNVLYTVKENDNLYTTKHYFFANEIYKQQPISSGATGSYKTSTQSKTEADAIRHFEACKKVAERNSSESQPQEEPIGGDDNDAITPEVVQ